MSTIDRTQPPALATQVGADHYHNAEYNTRSRYYSFAEQIAETIALDPTTLVEVGVGNGVFTRAMRSAGVMVTTVDFDPSLGPDIVASVESLPIESGSADVSVCFQVLEHLPFDRLPSATSELARVARDWVHISLPDARPSIRFELARGWLRSVPLRWAINRNPFRQPPAHVFDGQHYWEIGKRGTPESAVISAMTVPCLTLVRHYRLHSYPYHHFFLFRKSPSAAGE